MRIFTVHLRRQGLNIDQDLKFIKEGFCWPAFFFSFLWAFWHGLWFVTIILFFVNVSVYFLLIIFSLNPISQSAGLLGAATMVGLVANDMWRWTLTRRGFADGGLVVARDRDFAEHRFLEANPKLSEELRTAIPLL